MNKVIIASLFALFAFYSTSQAQATSGAGLVKCLSVAASSWAKTCGTSEWHALFIFLFL